MAEKKHRRDSAGSFKIPSTKDGHIKIICPLPGHLEIYTPGETFKVLTPETIDPGRTNPNAMWVNAKTHDVGSASPYIARTFIMASEILKIFSGTREREKEALLKRMHAVKELLLQCDAASKGYLAALESEDTALEGSGFATTENKQALVRFPVVPDIEAKCTAFLIAARRIITETCQIPSHFWLISRSHSSVEHLVDNDLLKLLGEEHRLVKHLRTYIEGTKRIIDFRNGQEHASTSRAKSLHIKNFETLPTNQIMRPVWFLDGEEPEDIASHMEAIPEFLLRFVETTFVGCIDSTLPEWPPFYFEEINPVDPECPTRYRLNIDAGRLGFNEFT